MLKCLALLLTTINDILRVETLSHYEWRKNFRWMKKMPKVIGGPTFD